MDATVESLVVLRKQVQGVRDALKELGYTRPPVVGSESIAKVQQAAQNVRAARQSVHDAEASVEKQIATCRELASQDASDAELRKANAKLREARESVELAALRAEAAAAAQTNVIARVHRDAEHAADQRRQACFAVLEEIGGPPIGEAPNETLGCFVKALANEGEQLASSYRHETIYPPRIQHEISNIER